MGSAAFVLLLLSRSAEMMVPELGSSPDEPFYAGVSDEVWLGFGLLAYHPLSVRAYGLGVAFVTASSWQWVKTIYTDVTSA